MTTTSNSTTGPANSTSLAKSMLLGAGIALILISLFLLTAGTPNPAWPKLWMLKPLLVVPFAGAVGGAFYYALNRIRNQGGWKKIAANILSFIIFIFGLWIGTVLGLNGTMWD